MQANRIKHLSNVCDSITIIVGRLDKERKGDNMDRNKTMSEIQEDVDTYISQFKEGYFSPLAMTARLTEELGELAREVNHYYGEKPKKKSEDENTIHEEVGDLFFVMVCLANSLNINLDDAFSTVMEKFETRDEKRWTKIEEDDT